MGYRIVYPSAGELGNVHSWGFRRVALTGLSLILFCSIVSFLWPEGKQVMQEILFSGDLSVMAMAVEEFTRKIREGTEIREAFAVFCSEILEGAGGHIH